MIHVFRPDVFIFISKNIFYHVIDFISYFTAIVFSLSFCLQLGNDVSVMVRGEFMRKFDRQAAQQVCLFFDRIIFRWGFFD
jgi:hypothetical protein